MLIVLYGSGPESWIRSQKKTDPDPLGVNGSGSTDLDSIPHHCHTQCVQFFYFLLIFLTESCKGNTYPGIFSGKNQIKENSLFFNN